jgi:magnesium transporter
VTGDTAHAAHAATPTPAAATPTRAATAIHGIGSHGGHAAVEETVEPGADAGSVVVHRPGYPPRRLEPAPGIGRDRPARDPEAIAREASERLRASAWHPDGPAEETSDIGRLVELVADPSTRLWVDLTDPSRALVAEVAETLGLHPLVAEDITERGQRPKLEITGDVAHIVVYALAYDRDAGVTPSEIDLVLGRRFILTSHEAAWDPRQAHQLRGGVGPVLAVGPDYLAWALIDSLVDSYFPIFDGIDEDIDTLEDEVIATSDKRSLTRLFELKRTLVEIRHVVSPMREVFNQLTNRELPLIQPETTLYFRDVYDHLIRLNDELDSYRELASGILDVYLSTINNNLSLIMKRLTGVTVILAGIGAVGGLFGMSEAGNAFNGREALGFWVVTGFVLLLAGLVALLLRKIDWI